MTRLLALPFALLTVTACGGDSSDCPDGFGRDNNDNCVQLGGDGGNNNGNNGNNGNNDPDTEARNQGNPVGDACRNDGECSSDLCVFQYGGDVSGVCTESCNSWSDCSESFWECCDLSNGGFVCTPDSWVDEFGLECN